ncbi:MAG: autotransporter assembly complex family protein [Pseudomonadota bacterium]
MPGSRLRDPRAARYCSAILARALSFGLALTAAGCASTERADTLTFEAPETQLSYGVALRGAPSPEIEGLLETSLAVFRRQELGAQSLAFLRRRAAGDGPTAQKILRSYGFYDAAVSIDVEEVADAPGSAQVTIEIDPGRAFKLTKHDFILVETGGRPVPPLDARELGSPVGEPAEAAKILDAESAAVTQLRSSGRPYARRLSRDAVADPAAAEIEVATQVAAGPSYVFGATEISGLETVDPDYLRSYEPWIAGDPFDTSKLAQFQRALTSTRLFRAASVRAPETPPPGPEAPIEVIVEEAPHRTIGGGVRYDTDIGPAVRAEFEHRNLFGANETLGLALESGLEEQRFETTYAIPQFRQPNQLFKPSLELRRVQDEAFDEVALTLAAGLERPFGPHWVGGIGGLFEASQTEDKDEDGTAYLFGAPAFARFDDTDDRLNPTKGVRFRGAATPFAGAFDGEGVTFLSLDGSGSTYADLTGSGRYILASRARIASILAADLEDVPLQRRLYSGGGGSVRGFKERFIGPLDEDGDPDGGLSAVEIGVEMRVQATDQVGFVVFSEAGSVSEEPAPIFDAGLQSAAGVGLRYFSPIGPVRFDIAAPLDRRPEDDLFQFYVSLGQAF